MPPKKSVDGEERDNVVLLGRFKNTLKCGIVGLPNVGKSSFFNLLTGNQAPAANYPFCTKDPNDGICVVPDERYDYLCELFQPKSQVPAVLHVTDIAGLVKGASQGEGLGNAFLSHISAVDGIMHMIRVFEDDDVTHVEGGVDPVRDLQIIHDELRLKDIATVQNTLGKVSVAKRRSDKKINAECELLEKFIAWLEDGKLIRHGVWNNVEVALLNTLFLLTSKPSIYLINLSPKDFARKKNKWLKKIKEWLDVNAPNDPILPLSVLQEEEFAQMNDAERTEFEETNKCKSMLPKVISSAYHHLRLVHFFTVGTDEVRCWTIREGTKAPQAAGTIHSDMELGFICAEVVAFENFKEHGTVAKAKSAGQCKNEGKGYIVKDGDIIKVQHGTVTKKKK